MGWRAPTALLCLATCSLLGCTQVRSAFEPVAKRGDVQAVQETQTGLVNTQARIQSEINGLRNDVVKTYNRQIDPWYGALAMMLLVVPNLDSIQKLFCQARRLVKKKRKK